MSTLWLICDVSGSMVDAGKRFVARGLVRQVEQYVRLGYAAQQDLKLVAWGSDATLVPWTDGDEVPARILDCGGSSDGAALVRLLGRAQPGDMFLLFTDGFWSGNSQTAIKQWRATLDANSLRVIRIGADANPKLAGSDVFEADSLLVALDGWLAQ